MTKKIRPNEPCPCGSGRKYKKCCGQPGTGSSARLPHTPSDRISAFSKLDCFIDELWEEEEEDAFEVFWSRHLEREGELPEDMLVVSRDVQETWFAFDYQTEDGGRVIDEFLEQAELSLGERSLLETMRASTMRLYEVTDTAPGSSMTLRDLLDGTVVTVSERTASRTVSRHECLAARVIARGCSGRPEMERGVLPIPPLMRETVLGSIKEYRGEFLRHHRGGSIDEFYKGLPPLFHEAWLTAIFEPPVPKLANTAGEEMIATRVSFHVEDEAALERALDGEREEGLGRTGSGAWHWSEKSTPAAGDVSLGTFVLRSGVLTIETNSVERGKRARELVERLSGKAIKHRGTTHEDVRRKVMEALTARALGRADASDLEKSSPPPIDPNVAEALVLDHYARHYRAWVDEPVPALDGRTPRQAAQSRDLQSRVEDLIRGLEGMYERALKDGEPAYDPSWMWAELGLETAVDSSNPPPMAHERVADRLPGSAQASRTAAERARSMTSFEAASTTLGDEELRLDLELQRFLRSEGGSGNDSGGEGARAAPYLPLMVNFDLHRRKVFWVDGALSYMLENTELDVKGRELRAPFPSFALVYADRHALSLGERLLSRDPADPLRGQILRVATVYVTEEYRGASRVLAMVFAFDALGADLPSLVRYEVPADDDAQLHAFIDSVVPRPGVEPAVRDPSPTRALLRLVLNSILFATSAGVTPEVKTLANRNRPSSSSGVSPSSESVFYLPGKIDIRLVRHLQDLQRVPEGRSLFARFMVRGHWRRPAKTWTEQRLRWIEPYWKGPDMAAVIEKAYRLKA
jgi:hypothetical protein